MTLRYLTAHLLSLYALYSLNPLIFYNFLYSFSIFPSSKTNKECYFFQESTKLARTIIVTCVLMVIWPSRLYDAHISFL